MALAFGRSEQDITLAVSVYLVFQALTPSFLGSLSDSYGRRPVAISTLALYLGANIGLALVPTTSSGYAGLLILRALQVCRADTLQRFDKLLQRDPDNPARPLMHRRPADHA